MQEEPLKIILLEDADTDAELIYYLLKKSDLNISFRRAHSKDSFIECIKTFPPDLVLSDYSLPTFDGPSALAIIRQKYPDTPFIFVSGAIGEDVAIETLKMGAIDYVLKERLSRLIPAIKRALQQTEEKAARRKAEEEVKVSRARLSEAQRIARLANWEWLIEKNEFCWSDELYQIFQLRPDELGNSFEKFLLIIHPDDRTQVEAAIRDALSSGGSYSLDHRIVLFKGEVCHVHSQGAVVCDIKGGPLRMLGTIQDITERKNAEQQVELERDKLKSILDAMEDGVFIVNKNFDLQYLNPVLEKTFGSGKGNKCFDRFHDRSEACTWCKNEEVFSGKTIKWEWTSPKTGQTFSLFDAPIRLTDGSIGKLEILRDITEQKQAQEIIRQTKELLEKIFSNIHVLIAYMDRGFNFIRVNDAYAQADGHDPEYFIGKNHFELFPNEENRELFGKVVETGEGVLIYEKPFEYVHNPERGTSYWDWSLQPVKEAKGRVSGLVLSLINVTERKRAEQAARSEEAFRRSIENSVIAGILAADIQGKLTYVNRAFCRMVGWTEQELVGSKPPYVYWPHEEQDKFNESFAEILSGKDLPCSYERLFCKKNGERFHVLVSISPLRDAVGNLVGITGAYMDITERKRMEEVLKQSESQLKHLSSQLLHVQESERKRIAIELHDTIGQSLSAIKFKIEHALILKSAEEIDEACNSLAKVVTMVQHAIEEVRKICMDLRPSVLDDLGIIATISWFCREYQNVYRTVNIEQLIKIEEDEIPVSLKIIIFRIIQESLNNIAKHSDATTIRISLQEIENRIELLISDNGSGFDQYAVQARSGLGRGFGLASMKERTQLSGGDFELASIPGQGTTVKAVWNKNNLTVD